MKFYTVFYEKAANPNRRYWQAINARMASQCFQSLSEAQSFAAKANGEIRDNCGRRVA